MDSNKQIDLNIVIVDDIPENLQLLSNFLKNTGYRVRPFTKGSLALNAIEKETTNLILLDVNMPEMNGYDFCAIVKENPKTKHIPIIFISALTETFDKVKAFKAGGVDYITKPFQYEEVLARVKTHLSLFEIQEEIKAQNKNLTDTLARLKEAQQQLVQSEKMASLGVLTAGIAHEINNPINYISTSSQALLKVERKIRNLCSNNANFNNENKKQIDDLLIDFSELTSNVIVGVDKITKILHGLRIFSRMDVSAKHPFDIKEIIESALVILHNQYKNKITIETDFQKVSVINGYSSKISQAFINFIKNAIDAIDAKIEKSNMETIHIQLFEENNTIVVKISDTGIGMNSHDLNHIFEPFYTTKPVGKGTGLGLSISLGIIEEHNGTIEAKSTQGKGSEFIIKIPITTKNKDYEA
ncbi:MAG TPA: hybrid sensor histidine kinase/response regulator [Bacteroidales bacterium]|nr:MAG: hypothetical protein A2W98_14465 [Bacteroidetes bacterium GWF2_33_38]OFY76096.1 MAG: hypothetical protein A2265_06835 [Bacteroidetes bacterium RIFOXYA12_FULL_33_9]OFY90164.1 MAG: hypothetical protein A2236_12610 [Bacteroidetes bacterium RIFOXYA2_FULL_33_7]HBF88499.1 hybrid sensor histidine kinase/response regulator [Bacteroidales bacterium]